MVQSSRVDAFIPPPDRGSNTELVAIRVAEIRAIVVGVIMRSQSRLALALSTVSDGPGVAPVNGIPAGGEQRDHLPIARRSALAIVGMADKDKRPRHAGSHPAGPGFFRLGKLQRKAKLFHHALVEGKRALEIGDSDTDVRDHLTIPRTQSLQIESIGALILGGA
jgi:hypothetical protein